RGRKAGGDSLVSFLPRLRVEGRSATAELSQARACPPEYLRRRTEGGSFARVRGCALAMIDPRAHEIDVGALLENRPLGRFHFVTLALCFLILFVDGLDFGSANVGAPAILRAFGAEPGAMGAVFSWGYFGIFLGSVFFGMLGDRYGRKLGALLGVLAYSAPALLMPFASSLEQVALFRFLT